jgi:hypothetical protein
MAAKFDYKSIPPLQQYIDRIGAHQLNFRTFMIKVSHGNYYEEKAIIKIGKDGLIECSHKEYEPTSKEEDAIKSAFSVMKFPKQINAKTIEGLKSHLKNADGYHVFYDETRKHIIMVQERRVNKDGTKSYIPWTFFDDGEWRSLEPEKSLPFWKPSKKRGKSKLMIHEGAKAALFVDDLINNPKRKKELLKHPFGEELKEFEHWGMIGGALAPHRTDYKELAKSNPTNVVYICDNDNAGKSALQKVSRLYKKKFKGVFFDARWPTSWDLADEFPKEFFEKDIYKGPKLSDLFLSATWATEKVSGVDGKKISVLTSAFREEWLHCIKPEVFIHKDAPNIMYNANEFNNVVAPFSDVADTARLVKNDLTDKGLSLKYDPSLKGGSFSFDKRSGGDNRRFINTYKDSNIECTEGDYSPFVEFMNRLCPSEQDRFELMKWCATLIAKPEIKMSYGVLVISQMQGVGKTTLGEKILRPIVGIHNTSVPEQNQIVDSAFNEWQELKRLVVINEIYAGDNHKAYNYLKGLVTDSTITINKKFCSTYQLDNWLHIYACSNSMAALKLENDDRRWLVPQINSNQSPDKYWRKFYRWLDHENGLGKVKQWAFDFTKENGHVLAGQHAPMSEFKTQVVEESLGNDMAFVLSVLKGLKKEGDKPMIVSDQDVIDLLRNENYDGKKDKRLLKPLTVRKLAKDNGWFTVKGQTNYMPEWGVKMRKTRFITNCPKLAGLTIENIKDKKLIPVDLHSFFEEL